MIASTPPGPSASNRAPVTNDGPGRTETRGRVRDQYERYPYPPVAAPGQETLAAFALLDYVQHVFWPAHRELAGLRVLDAGCGTGNVAVAIARQHPEMQIVGIDLSEASLAEARAQAERLGVGDNFTLRRLAIEDVGTLAGRFDYVVASGVLHHLPDPEAGLRALTDVLARTGGLGLMLYATYGRQGVYMAQDLVRRLAVAEALPERVALTRKLLDGWQRAGTRGKTQGRGVVVRQHAFDVTVRRVELSAWQARVIERCDGTRSAVEVFELPEVYRSVPGLTPEEKLQAYGAFMELMAAQGVLLCCM